MKFKIKAYYRTGDSFGSEDTEDFVEMEWNNLDKAKENLKRIEEHYNMYNALEALHGWSYRRVSKEDVLNTNKGKDWFVKNTKLGIYKENVLIDTIEEKKRNKAIRDGFEVKEYVDETIAQNCIILYTDNNQPFQFWAPWCGYFESLHSVEIITDENDLKITF